MYQHSRLKVHWGLTDGSPPSGGWRVLFTIPYDTIRACEFRGSGLKLWHLHIPVGLNSQTPLSENRKVRR